MAIRSWPVLAISFLLFASAPARAQGAPPQVFNIQPPSAPTAGGVRLTIFGTAFGPDGGSVRIAGTEIAIPPGPDWTPTEIYVHAPEGDPGPTSVEVLPASGLVAPPYDGWHYGYPSITNVSPANGPAAGGTVITLTGQNFGRDSAARVARMGGKISLCTRIDHQTLEVTTPVLPAGGPVDIDVEVAGFHAPPAQWTVDLAGDAPSISNLSTSSGPTQGGTPITIYGTNFGSAEGIARIGSWPCTIDGWSDGEIACRTPAAWSGAFGVSVERAADGATGEGATFLYDPAYIIDAYPKPLAAAGGTVLTIIGENFGIAGAPREVTIDGQLAPEQQWVSHQQVIVTVPPGTPDTSVPLCIGILGKPGDCIYVDYGPAVGVDPPRLPAAFALRLAGANPSRAATMFAVDLPRDARYAIAVFNSAGRLVHRVEAEGPAGTQVVRWDGAAGGGGAPVPAGLYWARLEVAGQRFVQKVMRL